MPSLENRGGRLKSLLWAQLSLHTQCPNLPLHIVREQIDRDHIQKNGNHSIKSTASRKIESLKGLIEKYKNSETYAVQRCNPDRKNVRLL